MAGVTPAVIAEFAALVFGTSSPNDSLDRMAQALGLSILALVRGDANTGSLDIVASNSAGDQRGNAIPPIALGYSIVLGEDAPQAQLLAYANGSQMPSVISTHLDTIAPFLAALWAHRPLALWHGMHSGLLHPDNPYRLTQAEQRICGLIAQGLRPQDMAEHLNVSLTTVRTHLRQVYSKSGLDGLFAVKHHLQSMPTAAWDTK